MSDFPCPPRTGHRLVLGAGMRVNLDGRGIMDITEFDMACHQLRLQQQGYTIVPDALPPATVTALRAQFDALLPTHGVLPTAARKDTPSRDINRIWEHAPDFEPLMDLPGVFEIIEQYMNGDVTVLATAIGNYMPAHTPARVAWHRDGPYVRATYLLTDVTLEGGPTALLPGSHREPAGPPKWLNDETGYPRVIPSQVLFTAKAGSVMINDTNIWHTSTPNRSDRDRKLIWVVYKTADKALTGFPELRETPAFLARVTDPRRRRLLGLS